MSLSPSAVSLLVLLLPSTATALAQHQTRLSRRAAIAIAASSPLSLSHGRASATASGPAERSALLDAINSDAPSEAVLKALDALLPLDPSSGRAATSPMLDGTWRLLWSYGADKFSPLLGLPRPIRPGSLQLLGAPATATVGPGRVANLLQFPLGARVLLSSGVQPAADGPPSTLEIFPPFRLELEALGSRTLLVEAGSDADFRAINARDADAQAAPRNMYRQSYLETTGRTGDLRVSTVVSGDPVIVGTIFVHERVAS